MSTVTRYMQSQGDDTRKLPKALVDLGFQRVGARRYTVTCNGVTWRIAWQSGLKCYIAQSDGGAGFSAPTLAAVEARVTFR